MGDERLERGAAPVSQVLTREGATRAGVQAELEARRRLLSALETGGPRNRNVVQAIIGGAHMWDRVVKPMLAAGEIKVARGRGGRFGLPKDMK